MSYEGSDRRDPDNTRRIAVEAARQAVKEAVPEAIRATFVQLGIDPEKPIDAQKDSQWVRATRERCEGMGSKAILTVLGLLIAGSVTFVFNAVLDALKK